MSAFIVDRVHVDAMIRLGLAPPMLGPLSWFETEPEDDWSIAEASRRRRSLTLETASEVGQMLVSENVLSIRFRYPDVDEGGTAPGPLEEYWREPYAFSTFGHGRIPTAVEGLKVVDCFEYQSCEHPEWKASEARRFCEALRRHLIRRVPGYDVAPWEWRDERVVAAT